MRLSDRKPSGRSRAARLAKRSVSDIVLASAMIVALTGCGVTTGPTLQQSHGSVPPVPPDQSRVYVYRPYNFVGSAGAPDAVIDNVVVGLVQMNAVFYCDLSPGHHIVGVPAAFLQSSLPVDLAPGSSAYLRWQASLLPGQPAFEVVDPTTGAGEAQNMHFIPANCRVAPIARPATAGFGWSDVDAFNRSIDQAIRSSPPPAIPGEAARHADAAVAAIRNARSSADFETARSEYRTALKMAPWWADGWFNLAALDEQMGAAGDAATDLSFYLRASPGARDRDAIQRKIEALRSRSSR